ncbi:hypothetical protein A3842_07815 [Paenibacillus sp. P3E]|nr:hypothetical protein A3842_07815 [Paenibacillus sp. P3E]
MGRFINEDTYEGQIDNPLSFNLYTYVGNNPLIYYNPSGHSWKSIWNWTKNAAKTTLNLINEAAMAYPPLEGEVAQTLGNKVVGFRGKILGEARVVGDIDVETSKYIIEVTAGKSSKTSSEFEKYFQSAMNPQNKGVILYAPNLNSTKIEGIKKAGVIVIQNMDDLLKLINGKR